MKQQQKATGRLYNTHHQVVDHIPRWSIERLARRHGVDARKLSATSHVVLLMLGHLSQARCLIEVLDDATLYKSKLYLARRSRPTTRNNFSHANRTRPCEVEEELYWETARHLCAVSPGFVPPKRVSGFLSRFNERGIFAIDSTTSRTGSGRRRRRPTCACAWDRSSRRSCALSLGIRRTAPWRTS